ncbi:MAG TPA: nicotinamide riboside transporter PnuC [Bacteroidales bacterium]|nr:nicotinamide riboside transporter PnuC [Bacteroidales bacterium]
MAVSEFFDLFAQNILQTTLIEVIAVIFGLMSVWYSMRVNILVYPTGIVSVVIYVYICLIAGLYADMAINFIYFVMSVYGWYNWLRPAENKPQRPVRFATKKQNSIAAIAALISFFAINHILVHYTDSNVPAIDAFTTAVFIVGMWLMAEKKVENWIYWIIGDIVSIPLYFYKGLVMTSFQYTVFLVLAVLGFIAWKKEAKHA